MDKGQFIPFTVNPRYHQGYFSMSIKSTPNTLNSVCSWPHAQ